MDFNIIEFDQLGSTNDEASKSIYNHGDIILTHNQDAGRGQRGNKWQATAGENLTCTFVVQPTHIPVYEQFMISMIGAMGCIDALKKLGLEAQVKWPNDIYVKNNKIGGILIEHHSQGEKLSRSIIGIGINVNQSDFHPDIPNPTSLKSEGIDVCVSNVLEVLMESIAHRYSQNIEKLHSDFMTNIYRKGDTFYPYRDAKGEFRATIKGVDAKTGQLTLLDTDNNERKYWFKEVEIILY